MNVKALNEATTLFVYGSLRDPVRRQEIIGRQVSTTPATLHGYMIGRARYFFVRRCQGMDTRGLLLLNLTPRDFKALDAYEEVPRLYTREKVAVVDDRGSVIPCWVYLPTALAISGEE
ncbi:MAG TPA: gamma-glutamylcyclotransferase family protein [Candidatus Binataceae bacterium]|nr:gamma-glutamylcyclotransferase family protein [Candidatus Binataceae bacterium]